MIIAGAVGVTQEFYLYKWNGQASENGEAEVQKIENINLTGLNPEALIIYPTSNKVQILSDDGAVLIPTKNGKQVENKLYLIKKELFAVFGCQTKFAAFETFLSAIRFIHSFSN